MSVATPLLKLSSSKAVRAQQCQGAKEYSQDPARVAGNRHSPLPVLPLWQTRPGECSLFVSAKSWRSSLLPLQKVIWHVGRANTSPPAPLCSRDRAGRSAAPAGIPKGSQTTTYGSWSFHFSCKLLPAGKTIFLKMGRCTMHSPASSPPPPHPRNKKGSTEFAGSHLLLDIKRALRTCSCIHILKIEKWKSCPPPLAPSNCHVGFH